MTAQTYKQFIASALMRDTWHIIIIILAGYLNACRRHHRHHHQCTHNHRQFVHAHAPHLCDAYARVRANNKHTTRCSARMGCRCGVDNTVKNQRIRINICGWSLTLARDPFLGSQYVSKQISVVVSNVAWLNYLGSWHTFIVYLYAYVSVRYRMRWRVWCVVSGSR